MVKLFSTVIMKCNNPNVIMKHIAKVAFAQTM